MKSPVRKIERSRAPADLAPVRLLAAAAALAAIAVVPFHGEVVAVSGALILGLVATVRRARPARA